MQHKGCVMELREETMVVMTEKCNFYEIQKRKDIQEGMEVEFYEKEIVLHKNQYLRTFSLVAAAVLLLIIASIHGLKSWNTANQLMAVVTIDINPSIQLEVNNKNRVLKAVAVNKEAETLSLDALEKKPFQEAFQLLLLETREKGYVFKEQENYVLIATVFLQEEEIQTEKFRKMIEATKEKVELEALKQGEKIEVITIEATEDLLMTAREEKTSVGKLQVYQNFKEYSNSKIDVDTTEEKKVKEMKVKELIQLQNQDEEQDKKQNKKQEEEQNEKQDGKLKEHPIFDQHPGTKKEEKVPPAGQKEKQKLTPPTNDQEEKGTVIKKKEHPVFEEHPGEGKKPEKTKENKGKNSRD
ncbi:anti-sigma factor domain-containing protein [Clostridium formicaceticum]|uniref:Anti-sigma-I factor RsgI n=1 Tax=Clostridium formicaceticum TaxID=1497 RepID=A0AAC9RPS1_9CLOT|nr:anti-sigma factor domain-containing protein [Clostridium formicaceticum]AOY74910.1 hypothetical protein BJL90_02415 [Clostridium formicaceticum]ARE89317.1 Anti-sigma-I factor RsgI [Clostridium formicaceticum]